MNRPLLMHEVGSLGKPPWRVKPFSAGRVDASDVDDAREWGQRLNVPDYQQLVELLERGAWDGDDKLRIKECRASTRSASSSPSVST